MYKAVINLIPRIEFDDETEKEFLLRIGNWASKRYETITRSIHDAVNLVSNANSDSIIRIWNSELMKDDDIDWILGQWNNIEWRHLPGFAPSITDLVSILPTGIGSYTERRLEEIFALTIHHTVGWDYSESNQSNVITIAQQHSAKWPGIGYHYLIGPNGEIMRTNGLRVVSYHAGTLAAPGDENRMAVGVALGGDFRLKPPSNAQWGATSALVDDLYKVCPNYVAVLPHKRMPGAATVCPGINRLESWLKFVAGVEKWI